MDPACLASAARPKSLDPAMSTNVHDHVAGWRNLVRHHQLDYAALGPKTDDALVVPLQLRGMSR